MSTETDLLARGQAVAEQLWGARAGGQELPAQKVAPEFFALVLQFVFGMFWARPNLDLRSRSLCTVAQLAALGRTDELKGHLAGALRLGIALVRHKKLTDELFDLRCLHRMTQHPAPGTVVRHPLALELKCAVSWNLIVEPSEPVRCTVKVEWSTPFCLLSAWPNQVVKWPVKDGLLGLSGTAVTVPVIVPVAQKSPALLTV